MKNILITYQGGGYDGCIWEWNFCLFDKNGEFHDIYSSGVSGCDTEKKIIDFINDEHEIKHGTFQFWNLSKKEFGFTNTLMGGIVVELVNKLNRDFWDYDLISNEVTFKCDKCKNDVPNMVGDRISCNPVGCGGIVIMNDTKLCDECHSLDTCFKCKEYETGSHETMTDNGYCKYCYGDDENLDVITCKDYDDYDELEIDKEYKVFEYHRNKDNILTDITIVMGKWNDELEKYPVELFNVSYGVINPNQVNLF